MQYRSCPRTLRWWQRYSNSVWRKPVCCWSSPPPRWETCCIYTSRALTQPESMYAQIQKETLAIVHACKKFHNYVFGRHVIVQSEHKPLYTIMCKPLQATPMRLQRMVLRLQPYDIWHRHPVCTWERHPCRRRAEQSKSAGQDSWYLTCSCQCDRVCDSLSGQVVLDSEIKKEWPDNRCDTLHAVRQYWAVRDVHWRWSNTERVQTRHTAKHAPRHAAHQGVKSKQKDR